MGKSVEIYITAKVVINLNFEDIDKISAINNIMLQKDGALMFSKNGSPTKQVARITNN